MSREVVLKKIDGEYIAHIPGLGVLERAPDAESAYQKACAAADGAPAPRTQLRNLLIAVLVTLVAVGLIAATAANTIKRSVASLQQNMFETDPARMEKNREKFRALLVKYRPLIEEWQKATEKPVATK